MKAHLRTTSGARSRQLRVASQSHGTLLNSCEVIRCALRSGYQNYLCSWVSHLCSECAESSTQSQLLRRTETCGPFGYSPSRWTQRLADTSRPGHPPQSHCSKECASAKRITFSTAEVIGPYKSLNLPVLAHLTA